MRKIRYSRWDRAGADAVETDSVFDQLNDYMNDTGDLQQAMRRLMQRGLKQGESRVPGMEDLLSQVAREMRRLYEQYRLQTAQDGVKQQLESILSEERQTLDQADETDPEIEDKKKFLDRLPGKTSDAVERLADYDFENQQASDKFQDLLSMLGQTPLDLKEAQDLIDRLEELRRLEGQLSSMRPDQIDLELLQKLLGEQALKDFEGVSRLESMLEDDGYVVARGDHFELTPRGVRRIGQLALRDIFEQLRRDALGRHAIRKRGSQELLTEQSRPYAQGDALHINIIHTLKNALLAEGRLPIRLRPEDFMVYESEHSTRAATVLLLDMSWSMSWDGRFAAAKKVALAMDSLMRAMHPRDYFGIVGFFTRAVELKAKDLPEATWNMGDPFTNLQDGLHLASEMLDRKPSQNQQMIIITDGQPTAYCRQGRLYCEWPLSFGGISQRAAEETLREAERVTRRGITINTFMLDDSPVLKEFVDALTRINHGRAFYTRPERLGEYLLVDYVSRRRKRV